MTSDDNGSPSLDDVRERYRLEREKRLRADGNTQYQEFKGDFEAFDRDPEVAVFQAAGGPVELES